MTAPRDIAAMLHGLARLHVALGRMEGAGVSTRGWSYNGLVDGVLALSLPDSGHEARSIATLFDTLDGVAEIGPAAVEHLHQLRRMGETT
jgi:hypothetical protein